jgi:predicted membrane channel-forming protein YqfA (hemolysin III family)
MPANLYIAVMISSLNFDIETHFRDDPFGEYLWALSYVGCAAYWWFKPKETPFPVRLYVVLSQIPVIALMVIWLYG